MTSADHVAPNGRTHIALSHHCTFPRLPSTDGALLNLILLQAVIFTLFRSRFHAYCVNLRRSFQSAPPFHVLSPTAKFHDNRHHHHHELRQTTAQRAPSHTCIINTITLSVVHQLYDIIVKFVVQNLIPVIYVLHVYKIV